MNSTTEEVWRDVQWYEGLYQVSNWGRVRSLDRLVNGKCGSVYVTKGRILKPGTDSGCYLRVVLYKDNKSTTFKVHRLVASAFQEICGQYKDGAEVDHKNTVRTDNRATNLRWVTPKENCNNPLSRKHMSDAQKGEKCYLFCKLGKLHHSSKPIIQYDRQGEKLAEFEGLSDAGMKLNISTGNICMVLKGQRNHTHGYIFKYKDCQ